MFSNYGHKYGSNYFGKTGFYFKKYSVGGTPSFVTRGQKNGIHTELENNYIAGSGVGATNIVARRARMRRCGEGHKCCLGPIERQ